MNSKIPAVCAWYLAYWSSWCIRTVKLLIRSRHVLV